MVTIRGGVDGEKIVNITIGRLERTPHKIIPIAEGQERVFSTKSDIDVVVLLWTGPDNNPKTIGQCIMPEEKFKNAVIQLFGSFPMSKEEQLKELFK